MVYIFLALRAVTKNGGIARGPRLRAVHVHVAIADLALGQQEGVALRLGS